SAQIGERELERLPDKTADFQLPIGKSFGGKRPVVVVVDVGRAVRLEVFRDLGLAIFAGERRGRNERSLAAIGQSLGAIENALDPRLLGKLAVAAGEQAGARCGKPMCKEAAPVDLRLRAHD